MDLTTRSIILKTISGHMFNAIQWREKIIPEWAENAAKYLHKAEGLIELLEVMDCGSTGGFDKGQPTARHMFDRYDWLCRKYHNPDNIIHEKLANYFDIG